MTSYHEQGCHDTLCEGPEFLICGANNVLEHYGKRIEILHSILLRTELTGHGHPMPFLAEISCLTELAMLESFREPPRICATNSSLPPTDLKGIGNPDLPSVCSNYWPPIVALSLCFNHLVLSTFRQCRFAIPQRSAKPIASIHQRIPHQYSTLRETPSLM